MSMMEGDEDHEADDECGLQLREHECGEQRGQADVVEGVWPFGASGVEHHIKLGRVGVQQHEFSNWTGPSFDGDLLGDRPVKVGLQRLLVDLVEGWRHHKQAEEQRQPDQDLVWWYALETEGVSGQREDNDDAGEAGQHQHDGWRQREHRQPDDQDDRL
jgi:hypothetical protein